MFYRVLIWFGSFEFSVAIILTGNIDWLAAKKARLGAGIPGCTSHEGLRRRRGKVVRFTLLFPSVFLTEHSYNRRDFIRRQVEVMQSERDLTRERFNGGLGPTIFSPLDERENQTLRSLLTLSLLSNRESTFIHVLFIHSLNACRFSDPDTHREITAGGVRDMTWHGRHAYILVDAAG